VLHLFLPPTDRYRREWWWLAWAWLCVGVVLAVGLWTKHASTERQERQRLAHQAAVIHDNLARQLQVVDQALSSLLQAVSLANTVGSYGAGYMQERVQTFADAMVGVASIVWLDAHGQVRASSYAQQLGRDWSEHAYFQLARQQCQRDRLLVGAPAETEPGLWMLPVVRPVLGADGSFAGAIAMSLYPEDFATLLRSVVYAPDMYAMLIHADGQGFVWENQTGMVGPGVALPTAAPQQLFAQFQALGEPQSVLQGSWAAGQAPSMVALQRVQLSQLGLQLPLVVAVGRSLPAVFAAWHAVALGALALYVVVGIGVALGLRLMQQHLRRQEKSLQAKDQALDDLWHAVLVATGQGVWDCNPRTGHVYFSTAWKALLGYEDADIGTNVQEWVQRVHPDDWPQVEAAWQACLQGHTDDFECTHRLRAKDGSYRWTHGKGRVMEREAQGHAVRVVGTNTDLTELKRQAIALQEAQSMLQHLLHAMPVGLCMVDAQRRLYFRNQRFLDYFGYTETEVPTMDAWAERAYPDPDYRRQVGREWRQALAHAATHDGYIPSVEYRITTSTGEVMLAAIGGLQFGSNLLVTFVDRTAEQAYSDMLEQMAFVDALTGLPNRRQFDQRLHSEWLRCRRSQQPLAVLMIDIDYFKQYNDHYGHQQGDQCLRAVAQALRGAMGRSYDLVARYGGEEFVCLLPECTQAGAQDKAQQMLQAVRNLHLPHVAAKGPGKEISISIGVAVQVPDDAQQATQLLAQADAHLYAAKEAGRNRVYAGPASAMES
jgi:diguanylate cyclase (GGDEF)-like protein/PAS domain S-box-containing protein